jgi:hypothetical protein
VRDGEFAHASKLPHHVDRHPDGARTAQEGGGAALRFAKATLDVGHRRFSSARRMMPTSRRTL